MFQCLFSKLAPNMDVPENQKFLDEEKFFRKNFNIHFPTFIFLVNESAMVFLFFMLNHSNFPKTLRNTGKLKSEKQERKVLQHIH